MRRLTWTLGVIAAALLAGTVVAGGWVVVHNGSGYAWPEETRVPVDGRPHHVSVARGTTALVWQFGGETDRGCTVRPTSGGPDLDLGPGVDRTRPGKSSLYVVRQSFTSPGQVQVTCTRPAGSYDAVHVQRTPRLPPAVDTLGSGIGVPLVLGVTGLAVLLGAVLAHRAGKRPAQIAVRANIIR